MKTIQQNRVGYAVGTNESEISRVMKEQRSLSHPCPLWASRGTLLMSDSEEHRAEERESSQGSYLHGAKVSHGLVGTGFELAPIGIASAHHSLGTTS